MPKALHLLCLPLLKHSNQQQKNTAEVKHVGKHTNPTTESMLQPHLIPLSYLLWFSRCYFLQVLSPCSSSSHPTSRCSSAPCLSLCLLLGGTLELMHSTPALSDIYIRAAGLYHCAYFSRFAVVLYLLPPQ